VIRTHTRAQNDKTAVEMPKSELTGQRWNWCKRALRCEL